MRSRKLTGDQPPALQEPEACPASPPPLPAFLPPPSTDGVEADARAAPGARHPSITVLPDAGRDTLPPGRCRNGYILGLSLAEGEALLDELRAHARQPRFAGRQEWKVGDVIQRDNRSTLHRRDSFDADSRRRMHRTRIEGAVLRAAPRAQALQAA